MAKVTVWTRQSNKILDDLDTHGLDIDEATLVKLFSYDTEAWSAEADVTEDYFRQFGEQAPTELFGQLDQLRQRIADA